MKKKILLIAGLAVISHPSLFSNTTSENMTYSMEVPIKSPEVLEVITNYKTISEALLATKSALMKEQFIASNGIQETSFTAKRTTGSEADYYIADVMATKEQDDAIKITITFMKIGSGMLKLSKVSNNVKQYLNVKEDNGNGNNVQPTNSSKPASDNQTKKAYFGFVVGGNASFAKGDDMIKFQEDIDEWGIDGSITPQFGLRMGLLLEYSFNEKVSLNSGIIYTQKGWNTMIEIEQEGVFKEHIKVSYFDVPLLLSYNLNKTVYLQGGPIMAFTYKDEIQTTFDKASDAPAIYESYDREDTFKSYLGYRLKKRVLGYQLGIGLDLNKGWGFNLTYQRTGEMLDSGYDYANASVMFSMMKYFGK